MRSRSKLILKENNINSAIRSLKVQLISVEGKNIGLIDTRTALYEAAKENLDLVQIAFNNNIPICQIMDYGKFKYEQHKKQVEAKKKQPKNIVKEIKLTPRIEKHDIEIKVRKTLEFIKADCTVRVSISFRGRENTHKEIGYKIIENFKNLPGVETSETSSFGNQISLTLTKAN
jgi:translation initiation factor IF-3